MTPREAQAWAAGLIGRTVADRYVLRGVLGIGGMGAVFDAEHAGLGRRVALKVLRPEYVADRATVERFNQEARAAAALRRKHIVDVLDVGVDPACGAFLVMEHLAGESLEACVKREGRFDPARAAAMVRPVLDTLAEVHARGIVHRDLKPANLFLARTDDGEVVLKVLDFGISRVSQPGRALTAPGAVLGTPRFMAPEQAAGLPGVDGRADLYAVGAILYALLAGRAPYADVPGMDVLIRLIERRGPIPIRVAAPSAPEALCAFVERAMSFERDARFVDAPAMRRALDEAMNGRAAAAWAPASAAREARLSAPAQPAHPAHPAHPAQPVTPVTPASASLSGTGAPTRASGPNNATGVSRVTGAPTRPEHDPTRRDAPLPETYFSVAGTVPVTGLAPSAQHAPGAPQPLAIARQAERAAPRRTRTVFLIALLATLAVGAGLGAVILGPGQHSHHGAHHRHDGEEGSLGASQPSQSSLATLPQAMASPPVPAMAAGSIAPANGAQGSVGLDFAQDPATQAERAELNAVRQSLAAGGDPASAGARLQSLIERLAATHSPAGSSRAYVQSEALLTRGESEARLIASPARIGRAEELGQVVMALQSAWRRAEATFAEIEQLGHADVTRCGYVAAGQAAERMADAYLRIPVPDSETRAFINVNEMTSMHRGQASVYVVRAERHYATALMVPGATLRCRAEASEGRARATARLANRAQ